MDTRVAILAIIAHDNGSAQEINAILHEHADKSKNKQRIYAIL